MLRELDKFFFYIEESESIVDLICHKCYLKDREKDDSKLKKFILMKSWPSNIG